MDTGSTEYTIVYRALDPKPDYNLMLLKKGDRYCILYEHVTREHRYIPNRCWYGIDGLVQRGIRHLRLDMLDPFAEMGNFIREYVGEARWILATLANM